MKVGFVYILGGEPLIRPDFSKILDHFQEWDLPLMLNTNGWFVDADWARRLSESSVQHLRFSLDGASAETHDALRRKPGAFERVIRGIKLCRDAKVPKISCSYTMTRENYHEIEAVIELLIELGVAAVQFGPIADTGRAVDHPELSLDAHMTIAIANVLGECIKRYGDRLQIYSVDGTYDKPCTQCVKKGLVKPMFMGCQAGRTCFCIDWEGNIIPCLIWREPLAGSVRKQSLLDIWQNSPLFQHLRRHRGDDFPECNLCDYSDVCARECPISPSQKEYDSQRRRDHIEVIKKTRTSDLSPCKSISQKCMLRANRTE
jgi:AdoMet-dependent heme synthase